MKKSSILLILPLMLAMNSCKKATVSGENPLLTEWTTPYGVPPFDQIKPEHYKPAFEAAMKLQDAQIDSIANNSESPTFENTILALDNSGEMLNHIANVFFMVGAAETNPEMQAIEQELSPILSQQNDKVLLNEKLFQRVKSIYDNKPSLGLDSLQTRLVDKTYKMFSRNGANLNPDDKEKLKAINEQLSILSVKFGNNLLADNKKFVLGLDTDEDVAGLPESIKSAAMSDAKKIDTTHKYIFTLNKPSLIPFITYADNRELRKKMYKGYLERCNYDDSTDNKKIINDIVRLRTERANLLGFPTHAAFVLDNVMAKTPDNVYSLLNSLWKPALERAKVELEDMKAIMKQETGNDDLQSWDWWYYAEKVRKAKYDLDEEMLRPYFSLENVRSGIFDLSNRLYGITFRPVNVPVYHSECQTYEVLDADNTHLGVLYMDFHPRDGKRGGAWCGEYRAQTYKNGERVAPVVSIVGNFTRPVGNSPALLNIDEVETFFHEFGHALHGLFSDVKYNGLANVERDFVELPSQIMENWAFEPELLKRYATHYNNGTVIPDYLIEKIKNSRHFNQGFATVEYLAASYSDLDIYNIAKYAPIDIVAFEKETLNQKRGLLPEIAPRYRYPYFSHIFDGGYASGYYSYIWAEVLDKDAYQAFVDSKDMFNKEIAKKFRTLLSSGGSKDGMDLYMDFRGVDPSKEPLLKARGLMAEEPAVTPAAE